jgi:nucleotide-binding universal stress UspA family protein
MRILLAVDDSEHSNAATNSILARPWPTGSTVRVVCVARKHVAPIYIPMPSRYDALSYEEVMQSLVKEAQGVIDRTTAKLSALGMTLESRVRQGDARQEIVDEAKDWAADLIVVGSHGRTGIQRWLLGSVAEHVVRHAPCSVEVVRQPTRTGG